MGEPSRPNAIYSCVDGESGGGQRLHTLVDPPLRHPRLIVLFLLRFLHVLADVVELRRQPFRLFP
jgi:hypothetical protein